MVSKGSILSLIYVIIIVLILILGYMRTLNTIEDSTLFGGSLALIGFGFISYRLSVTERTLPIGLTSIDAVKFAIKELNSILENSPEAILDIAKKDSHLAILGSKLN